MLLSVTFSLSGGHFYYTVAALQIPRTPKSQVAVIFYIVMRRCTITIIYNTCFRLVGSNAFTFLVLYIIAGPPTFPPRSLTPGPFARAFSDPIYGRGDRHGSLRAPRSPKSAVAVRLFTSSCDDAQASVLDLSDSPLSEATKSPRNSGYTPVAKRETISKLSYDELNARYEALVRWSGLF